MSTENQHTEHYKYKTAEEAQAEGKLKFELADLEERNQLAKYRQEARTYMDKNKDKIIMDVINEYTKSIAKYNEAKPPYNAEASNNVNVPVPDEYYNKVRDIYYEESASACKNIKSILNTLGYNITKYEHTGKDRLSLSGFTFKYGCYFR